MRNKKKKLFIIFILCVYLVTNFFQTIFYTGNNVYAAGNQETKVNYTNIIAVIVNDNIYDSLKSDIQWYATDYIQGDTRNKYNSISNSQALVFPIDTKNFSAKNITQLLENIYFGGIDGKTSKLVGIVLIGDIPLPVVNQNGYIFPTIYPYVDFEEQKFIWDEESQYFVYNNNQNGQAEIWHGMINFGNDINEYKSYFNKLKEYRNNPESFVDKAIWYEDFIGNTKHFNETSLNAYLNNFIFAEDLGYHRYSDLMVKVMQGQRNDEIGSIIQSLAEFGTSGSDILNEGLEALTAAQDNMNTPTMQIKTILDNGYLDTYSSLFGQKYLKQILDNVQTANRWIETITGTNGTNYYVDAVDTVYKKAEITDEVLLRKEGGIEPFLIMINNALEEAVDQKVEKEKYRLNEVLPLTYLKYKGFKRWNRCFRDEYDAYENYYFGENAKNIQNAEQTSTYRGTFRNFVGIDGLTIQNIQDGIVPSTDLDIDLNKKSIGGSYEIFAQQVDANRGYNYNNSIKEYKIYSGNKIAKIENRDVLCVSKFMRICWKRAWTGAHCDLSEDGDQSGCEDMNEFAMRIWGGASPLNLTGGIGGSFTWKSGYLYSGATSPIFDIAGSQSILSAENESTSFKSISKYSQIIQRKYSPNTRRKKYWSTNRDKSNPAPYDEGYNENTNYDIKFVNKIPLFSRNSISGREDTTPLTANDVDYFSHFNESNTTKEGTIIKIKTNPASELEPCKGSGEIYTYTTIDSRVKNDSVNEIEVNGRSYKVFQDESSRSKQLYDEITHRIEVIKSSVESMVSEGNSGGLINYFSNIDNEIDNINSGLLNILSTNIETINGWNASQVNQHAEEWKRTISEENFYVISGFVESAKDELLTLSGYLSVGSGLFAGTVNYINEQTNIFTLNGWTLIFWTEWKTILLSKISEISRMFSILSDSIQNAENSYDEISSIMGNNVISALNNKKDQIDDMVQSGGCSTGRFIPLCDSIDAIIELYNVYQPMIQSGVDGIKHSITSESLNEDEEDSPIIYTLFRSNNLNVFEDLIDMTQTPIDISEITRIIRAIPSTGDSGLVEIMPGMNSTTSDRPIDSPKYLTFKGIGGDKVTFIYPDIYKAEIFSGDSNALALKSTGEIKQAIIEYLTDVVKKYNSYLTIQANKKDWYYNYNGNSSAYNKLDSLDQLANPNHKGDSVRPYSLFDENYLIDELEFRIRNSVYFSGETLAKTDPIGFIANMIYYQNITWQTKTISGTIQGDFDNQRKNFDINEKVSYLMENYLVSENNKGKFLTPSYRDSGYEVAFVNSDGNDYLVYEVDVPNEIVNIQNANSNYTIHTNTQNDMSKLEEELINECNIPLDGGVLLFAFSGGSIESPWAEAVKCRFNKVAEKPFEFKINFPFSWETGLDFWDNMYNIFELDEYKEIGLTYPEQLNLLNTDDINEDIISNMDLSNPGDAAKLHEILSYTIITNDKSTVSADNPNGKINISSSKSFGNVDFHIVAMGIDKISLKNGDNILSSNITIGDDLYTTGNISFNPYNGKILNFEINTPIEGFNVLMFYMCLPGTQNLENCVRKSIRLDVVPGEVRNIAIQTEDNIVLEGASLPFTVKGTDQFGNNVGELVSQKFLATVSSGTVTLNGVTATGVRFSNFKKSKFNLNATGGDLDGKTINIQVSGYIAGEPGIKDSTGVNVIKGKIDTYSGNSKLSSGADIITGILIKLPDEDIYFSVDSINLTQANSGTIPKIQLKLVDMRNNSINISGTVTVKTKNGKLYPGEISNKIVTKSVNGTVVNVNQYSFKKKTNFSLSGGYATVYLLPSFSAGEDLLSISMPGIDDIYIPINVKAANPSIIKLSSNKDVLDLNSSANANLKIFDNRNNLIDRNVSVILNSTESNKLSLSTSGKIVVNGGSIDFEIDSHDKGGIGYIYAQIDTGLVPLNRQSPDTLNITVQKKMLPDDKLNVMYLNLFGDDRGNQWGYMSDHEKYPEYLINNSNKLLTVTTQLLDYEDIKYFPIIIDKTLRIRNLAGKNISFSLNSGFLFDITSIGTIKASTNTFKLEEARISDDVIDEYINYLVQSGADRGKNVLFYIPEQTDSILSGNEVRNSSIFINGKKVFSLIDNTFDQRLYARLTDGKIAGYQVRELFFDDTLAGKLLFAAESNDVININLNSYSADYGVTQTWIDGSSDKYGLGFYLLNSELSNSTFGYKSIQDSYDINLGIGFTADFKNITNFGGGMPVGEATLPFSSELLINIGDPLLKRIDENDSAKIYDGSGNVVKDTEFDLGLGEVVYSEPGKEIFKVINIDFNNDDLEDIIVVFKDGTIKILKNYGGTNPFQNLGALMILADRIKDISIGDVDGNGYEDLLIWTEVGGLRVYLNNKGIFDVDGYPVCINVNVNKGEISEHPENFAGIHQIFLEDMDLDGALDIITNDNLGFIKIFYGGKTDGNINYLSTNKYMCDENWYERIQSNSKIVYQFGVMVYSGHILDQSLIHWQGISDIGSGDISPESIGIDSSIIENHGNMPLNSMQSLLGNITSFDTSAAEKLYQKDNRLKSAGFDVIPVYESGVTNSADIEYAEIGCLTGEDPVKIYKTYEDLNSNPIDSDEIDSSGPLVNGDLVRVSVFVEANSNFSGTFIDNILGPWMIPLSEYNEDTFENFWFDISYVENGYITSGQVQDMTENFHWDLENARYMIDNIHMKAGDKFKFSYGLIYNNNTVMDISIDKLTGSNFSEYLVSGSMAGYTNRDNYPDISVQPQDGCNDSMFIFFNKGAQSNPDSRGYEQKYIDLGKLMANYYEQANQNQQNTLNQFTEPLSSVGDIDEDNPDDEAISEMQDYIYNLAGIYEEFDWHGILTNEGLDTSALFNLGMGAIEDALDLKSFTNDLDKMVGLACKGVGLDLWGGNSCKGLPVPFNQAFLGEGKYHLFGCFDINFLNRTIGAGMPVLHAPAMRGSYPAVGFFGIPSYGPLYDRFYGLGSPSTLDSYFRLYVMPTMTMQLGIALCFGPYNLGGIDLPDPLGDIAGNCVVFAVDLPCKKSSNEENGTNSTTEVPYEYTLLNGCSKQNVPCYIGVNESSSPFILGGSSENAHAFYKMVPEGSYAGGFINIEVSPQTYSPYQERSALDMEAITLKGGATIQNKIRGSKDQGLIEIIVKKWLDKQIKYIMNNLTNFKISIIFPDFEGRDWNISVDNFSGFESQYKETEQEKCENRGRQRDAINNICIKKTSKNFEDETLESIDTRSQQHLWSRDQISSQSNYTNPFKELEKAFDGTSLVNISTQDITVNIPVISDEDITSYISMSQSWINRQVEILNEWNDFLSAIVGVCGGSTNIYGVADLEDAIKDLEERYKDANNYSQGDEDDQEILNNLQGKINALKNLRQKYNLSDLGNYKIYEEKSGGYYIFTNYSDAGNKIIPDDVYIYFDPNTLNLSMFTSGFDLIVESGGGKEKVTIKRNSQAISNRGLNINKSDENITHSCAVLFNDGTIHNALRGFLNMQATADTLIITVKQNIETLQQYRKFPLQLYERIHVIDRYLGDISVLLNSTLGTLSLWMETNANRLSQYIDAIISIITTLETYQMIIDFSADWTESCSTCTNDNYDQFSCKLGGICDMLGIELPVVSIPSMKIPSLYLDFSEIHIESDIKLPNLTFNPVAVPLPELPNLPTPPDVDLSMDIDEALAMGIDLIGQLHGVDFGTLSFDAGKVPLIPSPPNLPDLPSFVPTVEMELPLLPPAPKIPEIPNTIKNTVNAAKSIGKILCIIKGKIGLVMEPSIKAKVEQITQRTYEVPYRDNFDKTFSDLDTNADVRLGTFWGSIFTGFTALLQTNQFKDTRMKGFDLSLQTYVNIQFNLDDFYAWLEATVGEVNKVSYKINDYVEQGNDYLSTLSQRFTEKLQACTNNMFSIECLGEDYVDLLQDYNEYLNGVKESKTLLEKSSNEVDQLLHEIEKREDKIQDLNKEILKLNEQLMSVNNLSQEEIDAIQQEISEKQEQIEILQEEINQLNVAYGNATHTYNEQVSNYENIVERFKTLRTNLLDEGQQIIEQVQNEIDQAGESVNFDDMKNFESSIKSGEEATDRQKIIEKETRSDNLQNLYKDIEGTVSYVDYNTETNENNFNILKETLNEINRQTNNKDLKNKSQEYLNLIAMDREVNANIDGLTQVEKQVSTVIKDYKTNNDEIIDLIENDYDKFLVAVTENSTSLVSNNSLDITLSSKLFNVDRNMISELSNNDSIEKEYIDYNMRSVDGYLNALNNYSAESLNMDNDVYDMNKEYLINIKNLANKAYEIIDNGEGNSNNKADNNMVLLAQNVGGNNNIGNGGVGGNYSNTIDIANYIEGTTLNTKEGNFSLANEDYTAEFQSKFILTDINGDEENDLLLWDDHNIYIKYRGGNSDFDNKKYDNSARFYTYRISSYTNLLEDADENGIIKMKDGVHNLKVKLVDKNREVKNFKYAGQTFDTIKVSRSNNTILGDGVDGYLVKLIHRVDQFNDYENLINQGNNRELFDKKYVLVLPKGSQVTGTKLETEEGVLNNIETKIGTGDRIFNLIYFNEANKSIGLTISDLPRNRQYSKIYTLNFDGETYKVTSSSSNQIVAGPQIIADTEGPDVDIKLYRPATDKIVDEGTNLKGYVGTNYTLQADWEDNVALDKIWIADAMGNTLERLNNISSKTGHIELSGLYFTGGQTIHYYLGGTDVDGNQYVEEIMLSIDVPSIEIKDIIRGDQGLNYLNGNVFYNPLSGGSISNLGNNGSFISILAELNQDIDSGYIQFLRNRINNKWELLTGKINGLNITDFNVSPGITGFYGGYFDIGDDIGLYSTSGDMVAKINPNNGKITITPGFENIVSIKLDYSPRVPVVKIMQGNTVLFRVIFSSEMLVGLSPSNLQTEPLNNELFGEFNGGQAILKNNEVILYLSPIGQIYTDKVLYGEYGFDDATDSVIYTFRDSLNGNNIGSVKVKIKNLLDY